MNARQMEAAPILLTSTLNGQWFQPKIEAFELSGGHSSRTGYQEISPTFTARNDGSPGSCPRIWTRPNDQAFISDNRIHDGSVSETSSAHAQAPSVDSDEYAIAHESLGVENGLDDSEVACDPISPVTPAHLDDNLNAVLDTPGMDIKIGGVVAESDSTFCAKEKENKQNADAANSDARAFILEDAKPNAQTIQNTNLQPLDQWPQADSGYLFVSSEEASKVRVCESESWTPNQVHAERNEDSDSNDIRGSTRR